MLNRPSKILTGIIATQTDRIVQPQSAPATVQSFDSEDEDEVEQEKPEPVKMLDVAATFDEVVVWGHEVLPASDDTFVKGVEEWIAFAEAVWISISGNLRPY